MPDYRSSNAVLDWDEKIHLEPCPELCKHFDGISFISAIDVDPNKRDAKTQPSRYSEMHNTVAHDLERALKIFSSAHAALAFFQSIISSYRSPLIAISLLP